MATAQDQDQLRRSQLPSLSTIGDLKAKVDEAEGELLEVLAAKIEDEDSDLIQLTLVELKTCLWAFEDASHKFESRFNRLSEVRKAAERRRCFLTRDAFNKRMQLNAMLDSLELLYVESKESGIANGSNGEDMHAGGDTLGYQIFDVSPTKVSNVLPHSLQTPCLLAQPFGINRAS